MLEEGWERWLDRVDAGALDEGDPAGRRCTLLAPVPDPPNLYMVGANYADHLREMRRLGPQDPVAPTAGGPFFFLKPTTTLIGDGAVVVIGEGVTKLDWEVELAAVIGSRAAPRRGERRARPRRRLHDRQRRLGARPLRARGRRRRISPTTGSRRRGGPRAARRGPGCCRHATAPRPPTLRCSSPSVARRCRTRTPRRCSSRSRSRSRRCRALAPARARRHRLDRHLRGRRRRRAVASWLPATSCAPRSRASACSPIPSRRPDVRADQASGARRARRAGPRRVRRVGDDRDGHAGHPSRRRRGLPDARRLPPLAAVHRGTRRRARPRRARGP